MIKVSAADDALYQIAKAAYESGESAESAARRVRKGEEWLIRKLDADGVPIRGRGRVLPESEIIEAYRVRRSVRAVAESFRCSAHRVRDVVRKAGFVPEKAQKKIATVEIKIGGPSFYAAAAARGVPMKDIVAKVFRILEAEPALIDNVIDDGVYVAHPKKRRAA